MVHNERSEEFVSRRYSGWNRPSPVRTKKRRPFLKLILLLMLIFAGIYAYIFLLPALSQGPSVEKASESIDEIIKSYPEYEIGVSVMDVNTNEKIDLGEQSPFTAASTTKLITAALTMHEIEAGKLSLDTEINDSPVSWHLEQMINQSNNASWKSLNDEFGKKKMENYAKSIGLNTYKYEGNSISPKDMSVLLAKLYKNKLANKENTKIILSHMVHTNDDSFIPTVAETQDIKVYHKYGWYESNIHDVGLLVADKSTWALAVYTHPKDNDNHSTTSRDIIHKVTQATVNQLTPAP